MRSCYTKLVTLIAMEKPDKSELVGEKYARTGHPSIEELVAEQGTKFRMDPAELLGRLLARRRAY
jgi:hypothetical protein